MPGSTTRTKTRSRDSVSFNALQIVPFENLASVAASQTATTVQDGIVLPCTCKIMGASAYFSAIGASSGTHRFNIVAGTGTYVTTDGTLATDYGTVAGTLHAGDVVTTTFTVPNSLLQAIGTQPNNSSAGLLGIQPTANSTAFSVPYTITAADVSGGVGTAATSIATAINLFADLNAVIFANTVSAVVNFTALAAAVTTAANTALNAIKVSSIVTGSGATTTFAINAATFAGGTAATGTVIGVNDQFEYNGSSNYAPATSAALGSTPLFNANMALFAPPVGANPYWASNYDVVYRKGTPMTLRVITPSGGSVTNLKIAMLLEPFDVSPSSPHIYNFDPHKSIA